jgi:hypothetical protein
MKITAEQEELEKLLQTFRGLFLDEQKKILDTFEQQLDDLLSQQEQKKQDEYGA